MEEELLILFSLFGIPVTAYGFCIALAAGIGVLFFALTAKKHGVPERAATAFCLLCLPFGLVGARLFYCLARLPLFRGLGLEAALRFMDGGYALWGAVSGVIAAAAIAARIGKLSFGAMLDGLTAPGMLTVALGRFAEYFSTEGFGDYVENETLQFFPLAVERFEEWRLAIFMIEGCAALAIFVLSLCVRQKRTGDKARLAAILFCASQILLESLRRDNFLRWEKRFIRISELPAVLLLAAIPVAALIRRKKEGEKPKAAAAAIYSLAFLTFVGIFIWMEFAVQKSATLPVWACYVIEAVSCAVMGAVSWRLTFKK